MNKKNKVDFVFYFNNYSINKSFTNLKNKQENINIEPVWQELGKYNLDFMKLSSSLLSYLLNYKYVYFIIDGIDKEEDLENIIGNLNRYINRFHRGNKKLKVLISSRIKNFQLQQLFINSVNLPPLNTNEVQEFFYIKTEELQMNLHLNPDFGPLVDSQHSILRFDNKLTKTPLFAEVVLIILKEKGLASLVSAPHQSIASIYKLFVRVLYERSIKGDHEYESFYVLYRNLAYSTWESGNNLDIEEIVNIFKNSSFTLTFLVESGLLVQLERTQTDYSFIHQTIPDALAVEALVIKNDYSFFENKETIREDLQTYLRDEIGDVIQYKSLLNANPAIAAALLDRVFFNKISKNEFIPATRMIIKGCLEYTNKSKNLKNSDIENLLIIFKNLSEWQSQVYQILLEEVDAYEKNKGLITTLLTMQVPQINMYIIKLIHQNLSKNILVSLMNNNLHLKSIINQYFDKDTNSENEEVIILFAINSDIVNNSRVYKQKFIKNLSRRSDDELKFFFSKEKIRNEVLFKEYIHKDDSLTFRLNRLLSTVGFKDIFLPKGDYSFNNETVSNKNSITFSKTPFKKELNESSMNGAITKFQNDVLYNLWTFDQFRIAYRYFEASFNNNFNGFLGLHSFNDVNYEAVKENNINKVSFAYFENSSSNSNIVLSDNNEQMFHQTVLWRQIQNY